MMQTQPSISRFDFCGVHGLGSLIVAVKSVDALEPIE